MLDDAERKLLRILFNFFASRRRMPVWKELTAMTYKTRAQLTDILLSLESQQYIHWQDHAGPHTIVMIEGWERKDTPLPRRFAPADTSYWTQY